MKNLNNIQYTTFDDKTSWGLPDALEMPDNIREVQILGYVGSAFRTNRIPEEFWSFPKLEVIEILGCPFHELPPEIAKIRTLKEIGLTDCYVRTLPPELTKLKRLSKLALGGNPVEWASVIPLIQSMPRVRSLDIRSRDDQQLPLEVAQLDQLHELLVQASPNALWRSFLQAVATGCPRLKTLHIRCDRLNSLPDCIGQFSKLESLTVYAAVKFLPATIGQLSKLRELIFDRERLREFPPEICDLKKLRRLEAGGNYLRSLPAKFDRLTALEELDLRGNKIPEFPGDISRLKKLRRLDLSFNKLTKLPTGLEKLTKLEHFDFEYNDDRSLHQQAASIIRSPVKQLDVALPLDRATLDLDTLVELSLDLGDQQLTNKEVRWLEKQTRLEKLTLRRPTVLPPGFGALPSVRELYARGSKLERLPESFAGLTGLRELHLDEHPLVHLPKSMSRLASLEEFHLNMSKTNTLRGIPSLKKLRLKCSDSKLPDIFDEFESLEFMSIFSGTLKRLPKSFGLMPRLEYLEFWCPANLDIINVCKTLASVPTLRRLEIIKAPGPLPEEINLLSQVVSLEVTGKDQVQNPFPDLAGMTSLRNIHLNLDELKYNRKLKASIKKLLPNGGKGWSQSLRYGTCSFHRSL